MVECAEHPYHLRSEAPVLGAEEQYRKDQATVHTALDLRCNVPLSEETVLDAPKA
jgi:hypothetical protein